MHVHAHMHTYRVLHYFLLLSLACSILSVCKTFPSLEDFSRQSRRIQILLYEDFFPFNYLILSFFFFKVCWHLQEQPVFAL